MEIGRQKEGILGYGYKKQDKKTLERDSKTGVGNRDKKGDRETEGKDRDISLQKRGQEDKGMGDGYRNREQGYITR